MKILHVVGDSKFGGGSVVVSRLCQAAVERGWSPHVLTTDSRFQAYLVEREIPFHDGDFIWREIRPARDIVGLVRLTRWLREQRFDVIHTHTSKAGFVGRLAATWAEVPIILHTVHGFPFHEDSGALRTAAYSILERFAARRCDLIVTVSQHHRSVALKHRIGSPGKVVAIPNGISLASVAPSGRTTAEVRSEFGLTPDDILVLNTGRFAPQKGKSFLLEAIADLKSSSRGRVRFVLPGDGPLLPEMRELASQLGIENTVVFPGFRDDLPDLLHACDLLVLPSLWEGLSIALLEGMAAGKPILTTEIPSNLEVVQHGVSAILVPPKDYRALASAMDLLLADAPTRARLGERGHQRFREKYTEDVNLQRYMMEYERIAHEKGYY